MEGLFLLPEESATFLMFFYASFQINIQEPIRLVSFGSDRDIRDFSPGEGGVKKLLVIRMKDEQIWDTGNMKSA